MHPNVWPSSAIMIRLPSGGYQDLIKRYSAVIRRLFGGGSEIMRQTMTRLEAVEDAPDGNSVEETHRLVEHATQHLIAQSLRRYT